MFRNEIAPELVAVSVRQVVLHALDLEHHLLASVLMSALDGSGAVHTVLSWEAFGDYGVPTGLINNSLF